MSGVSVTSAPAVNTNVLMEILGASESVQARIAQYQDAKAAAESALEDLRIGRDAKQAYADADAKHAQAQKVLEEANSRSDEALSALGNAQAGAEKILRGAQDDAAASRAQVARERNEHENWIVATKAELQTQIDQLKELRAASEETIRHHDEWAAAAVQYKQQAQDAIARATAAEADFRAKSDALQAALAKLTGAA